jgi:mannose/cellobiose epimerase-like protein (N-acyl-D-glucosamine 2-epimerase family)
MSVDKDFKASTDSLTRWLTTDALPLWWARGADRQGGGFQELLSQSAEPVVVDRRARVQARQIYAYATGGQLGWTGPWRDAVEHGLSFFLDCYRMQNGLFRTLVHADGSPADDTVWLYDQAFALLALAEASQSFPDRQGEFRDLARTVIDALSSRRLPAGGFSEASTTHPYQSNPHMHLLEACLAWRTLDEDPRWDALVDEIIGLCLTKFIDANGALHEFFAEDWSFELGVDGRIVEPGHQFEWAWLLERWARLRNRQDARQAARRLYEIGRDHGVDRDRGVALDQLLDDFSIHQGGGRLWPQTERIKAAVILAGSADNAEDKADYLKEATLGVEGLQKYFATPIQGLWRDKMKPDGAFVDEPAPASSFYHIVCAISELDHR